MSRLSTKKTCVKCVKGTGIVTCDGCYQSFCHKHLSEHREELFKEINQINNQCEQFRQSLSEENDSTSLIYEIDQWEEKSIEKIHLTAENARNDVRKLTDKTINDFDKAITKITTDMEFSHQSNDTTEIDLIHWNDQLESLKDLIKQPYPIGIVNDQTQTIPLHFIKVKYQSPFNKHIKSKQIIKKQIQLNSSDSQHFTSSVEEKFHRIYGHANLSDDNFTFTSFGYSSVLGLKSYGNSIHKIKFKIISRKNQGIFFGIISSEQQITPRASELPSVYGWRDFDRTIIDGNAQLKVHKDKFIQTDDQLTLTIDCDHAKISLTHHQVNQKIQLTVHLNKSPLPWKLLVTSYGQDIISIIH